MTDPWKPDQYHRFRTERAQPFHDLVAMVVPDMRMRVVDLGCGTGELTAELHGRLEAHATLGIDSSAAMLERARSLERPGLRFEARDVATFVPDEPFDLVFSNAALHWIEDHPKLLGTLAGWLRPGGQLAVQVPANHGHASQTIAAAVASQEPFRSALGGWTRKSPVLTPAGYERALAASGFVDAEVHLRVYTHQLESAEAVVEWVKGTTLTDYERRLDEGLYGVFLERYRMELLAELGEVRPFFFPFQRILFGARRAM